jgi:hypothetical protein
MHHRPPDRDRTVEDDEGGGGGGGEKAMQRMDRSALDRSGVGLAVDHIGANEWLWETVSVSVILPPNHNDNI